MDNLLLGATEREVILCDFSDEEWDWTWITCADLSKCRFNLYGVFTVSFLSISTWQNRVIYHWGWMRETVVCAAVLRWLMETFSTTDSSKKVTGTTSSLRFWFLDFQNTLWQKISNWAFRMSVSHSPPHLCSHSACMPSITSHHTPLWVCMRTHHIISSEIQLSKGQVSSRAPLCRSPLQNANTRLPILA